MRIAHLADLHLGRKLNDYSLIENQRKILEQVVEKIVKKEIETVIIAGDIYDSPVPDAEAVAVLNDFLSALKKENQNVFMIAGNHDRGDYIEYGSELFKELDIHVNGVWKGKLECVDLIDRYGPLHVWCLPYLTPAIVNQFIEKEEDYVSDYTGAVRHALSCGDIHFDERNILVAHQYVDGSFVNVDGSEDYLAFGHEAVDPAVFDGLEYVALGHIHTAQGVSKDTIRYSGAPLKFTETEMNKECSFTFVTLADKGIYRISTVLLTPDREIERLVGTFKELMMQDVIEAHNRNYLHIVLDEEEDIPDAITVLRQKYPYILGVSYADGRIQTNHVIRTEDDFTVKTEVRELLLKEPMALFSEFYEKQNEKELTEEQKEFLTDVIGTVFREDTNETA